MTSDLTQRKHADTHEHFDKKVLFTIVFWFSRRQAFESSTWR